MSDSKPTAEDVKRACALQLEIMDLVSPDEIMRLAQESVSVREAEREACAKICDALATEAQQKFQPGWLLVTNGHHEAARRIRTRVDA